MSSAEPIAPIEPDPSHGATRVFLAFAFLLGVALRLLGYFSRDLQLWVDEATWAQMLVDGTAAWIRPPGYMWLTARLVDIVDNEQTLRSLSLIAGLAQLPLFYAIVRRLVRSPAVAVFGLYLLAIHPVAVAMTKEFKPYALEATLHTVLILCAFIYVETRVPSTARRALGVLVVVGALSPLFAWSVVFAFPGVFAVVGFSALRQRRTRDLAITAIGAVVTLVVLAIIFKLKVSGEDSKAGYWGRKYDVFLVGRGVLHAVAWHSRKTADIAGFPAELQLVFHDPRVGFALRCVAATLVGAGVFVTARARRFHTLGLLGMPWLICFVFNCAHKWPYGVFRTNLFLLVNTIPFLCIALDAGVGRMHAALLARRQALLLRGGRVALAIAVAAVSPWEISRFRIKPESALALSSSGRSALEQIAAAEAASGRDRVPLLLDGHACGIASYYTDYHVDAKHELGPFMHARVATTCGGFFPRAWRTQIGVYADVSREPFWVITAKPPLHDITRAELNARCASVVETELPAGTLLSRCEPLP